MIYMDEQFRHDSMNNNSYEIVAGSASSLSSRGMRHIAPDRYAYKMA